MCWNLVSCRCGRIEPLSDRNPPDGTERQTIKDMDGNMPRPKIRACSISDPFVLVLREDDSLGMFTEKDKGLIRRKDMSPMGDKVGFFKLFAPLCRLN